MLKKPCLLAGPSNRSLGPGTYNDERKLLLIIVSGMVESSGNDQLTPRNMLDIHWY